MQIMLLMGGSGLNMNDDSYPIYLSEVNGKLILEQQIENCKTLSPVKFIFCVRQSDIKQFHTDSVICQIVPDAKIIEVAGQTKGAVCTALLGSEYIDNDEELVLQAIDDFIEDDGEQILKYFHNENADAGVVSFNSVHPRYSFVKLNEAGEPVEFAEKHPISKNALVSFYYFKKGKDFVECAKEIIRKDNSLNGNFYISQTMNEMLLKQKKVVMYKISNEAFHPLKTEKQLYQYIQELKAEKESK